MSFRKEGAESGEFLRTTLVCSKGSSLTCGDRQAREIGDVRSRSIAGTGADFGAVESIAMIVAAQRPGSDLRPLTRSEV